MKVQFKHYGPLNTKIQFLLYLTLPLFLIIYIV